MQKNILIIERDLKICKFLKYGIAAAGHHAYYCLTGREGLIHLMKGHYDLVILELEMEGISGREILQITRSRETVPILVISSSDDIQTKVEVFQLGADDYMVKPVALEEVLARMEALCRRYEKEPERTKTSVLFCDGFTIDLNYKLALLDGKSLDLTRKEFDLLYYLVVNKGQVLSKDQIFQYVWKEEPYSIENTVMCQIYNLRQKIEVDPAKPKYIQTVWGFGYRFLPKQE